MKVATIANMEPIVWNEERVLTTEQVAEGYEVEPRRITENLKRNESRFIEGKHFYKLSGEDLKRFLQYADSVVQNAPKIRSLFLWTKRGTSLMSKIIDTDRAWAWQNELEENYFNPKTQLPHMSELEMIAGIAKAGVEQQKKLEEHDRQLANIHMDMEDAKKENELLAKRINNLNGVDLEGTPREVLNKMIRAYANKKGIRYDQAYRDFKACFNTAYRTNLELLITNFKKEKAITRKVTMMEFLEESDRIDDGIRVADKMLNAK